MAFTPFVETDQPTMAEFNEKFQECIGAALEQGVQIETGSYVGTGTYGSENPNSLILSFNPQLVIVQPKNQYTQIARMLICIQDTLYATSVPGGDSSTVITYLTWGDKTLNWYSTGNSSNQLNSLNTEYNYIAIGKEE